MTDNARLTQCHKRIELIAFLKEISSTAKASTSHIEEQVPTAARFDIDFLIHFLFDDTDLAKNSQGEVGSILDSMEEANEVAQLSAVLDVIIDELGDRATKDYVAHHSWSKVIEHADNALKLME